MPSACSQQINPLLHVKNLWNFGLDIRYNIDYIKSTNFEDSRVHISKVFISGKVFLLSYSTFLSFTSLLIYDFHCIGFMATVLTMDISTISADPTTVSNPVSSAKTNQNTVVVISDSITRQPAAAEARKRRKEILNKQYHRVEAVPLTENIVATAAAAAAAGLNLETVEVVPETTIDIPFLEDPSIAATAAAVAMNNSAEVEEVINQPNEKSKKKSQKRPRKEIKAEEEEDDDDVSEDDDGNRDRSKKTQIRYDPSIPMEKEQLAAWRREARRVRNRESAAASRQRIRGRITELEDEINDWKQKYHDALQKLSQFQQAGGTAEPSS